MLIKPILYSIFACFFWGLIFVIPLQLTHFSPFDIVLGRYFCFGVISMFIFFFNKNKKQPFRFWKQAFIAAFVMNIFYYTFLNLGLRFSSPSLIALLVGTAPITISLLMFKKEGKGNLRTLLLPAVVVFLGLILVNIETLQQEWGEFSLSNYFFGIFFGLLALGSWTWYVIYNTDFLKKEEIKPSEWTGIIGLATFFITLAGLIIRLFFLKPEDLTLFQEEGLKFLTGVFILGFFCSTLAFTLWNMASKKLTATLSGQIAILETVFGLFFIYTYYAQLPTLFEALGISLIIWGVLRALTQDSLSSEAKVEDNSLVS